MHIPKIFLNGVKIQIQIHLNTKFEANGFDFKKKT